VKKQRDNSAVFPVLILASAICLLLSAACRYIIPGVRFSSLLFFGCAVLLGGLMMLHRWARRSVTGRRIQLAIWGILAAGCAVFLAVEGMLLYAGERPIPEDEPVSAVVVLGAGVNGTAPSLTLRTRLNAAAEYLLMHPEIPAVLSGGQGPGEDITEAQAMYTDLVASGIAPERLLLEERSTSTAENLAFSREILQEAGLTSDSVIAVVTNDFHQFRTQLIAEDLGMVVVGIPAELPWWWLNANYYVREFFALGKLWMVNLFS
jgi:uncharacterized SAM-binding protein YcdF (DUF218 family)